MFQHHMLRAVNNQIAAMIDSPITVWNASDISGSSWPDSTGNGYVLDLFGNPVVSSDDGGTIITFDGVDDSAVLPADTLVLSGAFTIVARVRVDSTQAYAQQLMFAVDGSYDKTVSLESAYTSRESVVRDDQGNIVATFDSTTNTLNTWQTLWMRYNGSSLDAGANSAVVSQTMPVANPFIGTAGNNLIVGRLPFGACRTSSMRAMHFYPSALDSTALATIISAI